jgi:glycerophosphoryl diester phosphodiesterase
VTSAGNLIAEAGVELFAHRGFSGRYPEQTRAAYAAAIDFAIEHDLELGLECDVHFTKDDQLACLHDLTIDRTSDGTGALYELTLDELRKIDFGSWFKADADPEEKSIITLVELLDMVAEARERGGKLTVNRETKHPTPRGLEVDERVAEILTDRGWDGVDSPVRMITFDPAALELIGRILPNLRRTYLLGDLDPVRDGVLPDGVTVVGPDIESIRRDPGFVERARNHGNDVHVWTVNTAEDVKFCREIGVTGLTTDFPDVVVEALTASPVAT